MTAPQSQGRPTFLWQGLLILLPVAALVAVGLWTLREDRAAMERDGEDIDTRAHLGQCLLRQKRAAEARPLLEGVVAEKPEHDYGYSQMALAETLAALGDTDAALNIWKHVTENHSYPRAKVQLAELYVARNQADFAQTELREVIADDAHAPAFQRKRDRVWIRRAKSLVRKLG